MDASGLALCCRYAYPPNSLSLCGPEKQHDLQWYTTTQRIDQGAIEIITQFETLYPYLALIAYENSIPDPFDQRVVEAYWMGNSLLERVHIKPQVELIADRLHLKKKLPPVELERIFNKIAVGALPQHAFHVLNIYKRTGHVDLSHTVETMDACIINWGNVVHIEKSQITINTQPLTTDGSRLVFGKTRQRILRLQGRKDVLVKDLHIGNWISCHWGYVCQKLTLSQLTQLKRYTRLSLLFANST